MKRLLGLKRSFAKWYNEKKVRSENVAKFMIFVIIVRRLLLGGGGGTKNIRFVAKQAKIFCVRENY